MKKFVIMENSVEIGYRDIVKKLKEGCAVDSEWGGEVVKAFATEAEALKALDSYSTDIRELSGGAGTYYHVTEYYVQEVTVDDDGYEEYGDISAWTKMSISVYDYETGELIGTFNNYADAKKAANQCENCTDIKF